MNGILRLPYSVGIFLALGGGITWWRKVETAWADIIHQVQTDGGKQRMTLEGAEGNESVEWLNGIIAKLWPQVNADLFSTAIDLLEDIMQASIPSIVSQIKVSNVGQGTTPMRILSMRWLNEDREEKSVPSGGIDRMTEQEVGEWVSLEVAFSYRAQPSGANAVSKAKNAHLLLYMRMGLKGVLDALIPVWVELRGVTGTCRLKVQLIPDPPFIKLTTFSLMGMPKVDIAAVPLNQKFINVMNLPLISDFINNSIRTAVREYVAPSNYTLDMAKILVGDDTKKELSAVGVLVVHIHSAEEVKASDLNGKSDCYVTLSYSKFAKPLWSTRIIFEDLNPVWDETAVLLLSVDEVKAGEKLSVDLWDSDRFTADDILGRTEIDVATLIRNRGQKFDRKDKLMGMTSGKVMPGRINWSVTFWGRTALDKKLATDGADERLPKDLQNMPEMKSSVGKVDTESEAQVTYIPPDPRLPSGIISIQIHNIVGLERHLVAGTKSSVSNRKLQIQSPEEEEEGENLPSSYCSIILDHQKIYKTRVKPMTSKPFFNAGTERFIGDWTKSSVLVVVKDQRMREIDPILGVVEFKLAEVLKNASMISRFYPLQGGVGYGKIRVSLLFKAIETPLPRRMTGGDIGEVEIISGVEAGGITDEDVKAADCLVFKTLLGKKKAKKNADGSVWVMEGSQKSSVLGVRHRFAEKVVIEFRREGRVRRGKEIAVAVLWLKEIVDDQVVEVTLPVFKTDDTKERMRIVQNCIDTAEGAVGQVTFKVKFRRGLGAFHGKLAESDRDFADVLDAMQCLGSIIDRETSSESNDEVSSDEEQRPRTAHSRQKSMSISRPRSKSTHSAPPQASNQITNIQEDVDNEHALQEPENREEEESCGPHNPLRDLKKKLSKKRETQKELHRRERGMMQWKGARTLAWMGKGVMDKGKDLKGKFKMEPRSGGVESEVR
ncbi:hypothetical protein RUND412_009834 [Rhizina undulata]